MVERGHGGVINVSSLAGEAASPYTATYAATKAFVTSFSEALSEELRGSGVRVQVLLPGFTRTEFQERAGIDTQAIPGFAWMEPEAVVEASLAGLERGQVVCIPGARQPAPGSVPAHPAEGPRPARHRRLLRTRPALAPARCACAPSGTPYPPKLNFMSVAESAIRTTAPARSRADTRRRLVEAGDRALRRRRAPRRHERPHRRRGRRRDGHLLPPLQGQGGAVPRDRVRARSPSCASASAARDRGPRRRPARPGARAHRRARRLRRAEPQPDPACSSAAATRPPASATTCSTR